jgi:hypothetical protein
MNKNSTNRKVLTHLYAVKIAEQKLEQLTTTEAVEEIGDQDNLSQ